MWSTVVYTQKFLWGIKIPLKIKIFLWLITHDSILTKDVLQYRGWKGDTRCQFCGLEESIDHLFLHCALARFMWNVLKCAFSLPGMPKTVKEIWSSWLPSFSGQTKKLMMVGVAGLLWTLWNIRNKACFNNARLTSPFGVVKLLCYWLNNWSVLQRREASQSLLRWGIRLIEQVAREIFEASRGWNPLQRRIAW